MTARDLRQDCCARRVLASQADRVLASQADFLAQIGMLDEVSLARDLGFDVTASFNSYLHCEINYIECLWGFSKRIVRARYPKTPDVLKRLVSQSLAACDVSTISRWMPQVHRSSVQL